ncbi:Palladin [Camelus dromedarius]|nr:Palladin [Camelus dromedarius]
MSETSSPDSFYDSLSDVQEDDRDAAFFPGLSAFLSQEEIHRSLDLARRAIANSEAEDCASETEIPQVVSRSPGSLCGRPSHQEGGGSGEPTAPGRPLDPRPTRGQPPPAERAGHVASPGPRRRAAASPLLASPSYIRSLRRAGKHRAQPPDPSATPRAPHPGRAGPQSQLCDKAASFIQELTSIFREAARPRNSSPNGESSPDSGYLSPKNQPLALESTSASRSPNGDGQEEEAARLPEPRMRTSPPARDAVQPCGRSPPPPPSARSLPTAPRFTQKLRSQEVAEGSRVYLECRVAGHPPPRVR